MSVQETAVGRYPGIAVSPVMAVLALIFTAVLILQTARIMYLDANSIADDTYDISGFFVNAIIGTTFLYVAIQQKLIRYDVIACIGIFLLLLTINIRDSSIQNTIFSVLFSRYGVVIWFIAGIYYGVGLYILRDMTTSESARWFSSAATAGVFLLLIPVAFIVFDYLSTRAATESYQQVSSNAIILICSSILAISAVSRPDSMGAKIAMYLLLILATFLVYAIALMQSTSIVAFWLAILPLVLMTSSDRSNKITKTFLILAIAFSIYWIFISVIAGDLLEGTRFEDINNGILELSSVQSRLALLSGFYDQFAISPVFGAYDAELRAGYFAGNYMHSIVLSLLTHTGIVGSLIMLAALVLIWRDGQRTGEYKQSFGRLCYRLFGAIIILGSLFTFFTWMPFWLFLGLMSVRAFNEHDREAAG